MMMIESTSRRTLRAPASAQIGRPLQVALALALATACASTSGSGGAAGPAWGGDPAVVAAVAPLLATRAEELADVRTLEASCRRMERAADGSARSVEDGRLVARRSPSCVVMTVTTPKARSVREDATTRLVLDPLARGATRWTFESNDRGLLAGAALFLDLDARARTFEIAAVSAEPAEGEGAQRVVLAPRQGATVPVEQLELVLVPGQAVPLVVTVIGRGGEQLEYRIRRPTLDPEWRDPANRFRLDVPADYKLEELAGS
jgi:hypothetical protein